MKTESAAQFYARSDEEFRVELKRLEANLVILNDIDDALSRIADRTYGVCMTCGNLIDKNRLIHSPFVKTCTGCQQKLEDAAKA